MIIAMNKKKRATAGARGRAGEEEATAGRAAGTAGDLISFSFFGLGFPTLLRNLCTDKTALSALTFI